MIHPLEYENIIYIAVLLDDSGSIAGQNELNWNNTQDVIDGHNAIIYALKQSGEARRILFKTQLLNSEKALNNWVPLDNAQLLTIDNFTPKGTTPLYDKTISLLTDVIHERTEALKAGHSNVRWGILLITDGEDNASTISASEVKRVLDDMREKGEIMPGCQPGNTYAGSIALLGVEDRQSADPKGEAYFEKIAQSMGINWVLHADRAHYNDMRRAFDTFATISR